LALAAALAAALVLAPSAQADQLLIRRLVDSDDFPSPSMSGTGRDPG